MPTPITILGAGSFGTALAILSGRVHDVVLWARTPEMAEAIQRDRCNPRYLSGFRLPEGVRATSDLAAALRGREIVVCAVPSHAVRHVLTEAASDLAAGSIVVCATKGLEEESGLTMNQVIAEALSEAWRARIVALSGPSFAREIAHGRPTSVTLACEEETYAIAVQTTLSGPSFRCYTSADPLGVQLAGALKNVVAIAAGISDGLALGPNSCAALMTRGLAEIARLGVELGARPLTFLGLAGVGDLILTCTSDLSRNRRVGLELGRGAKLSDALSSLHEVAEGVQTTRAACRIARRCGVDVPVSEAIRSVLDGEATPARALRDLMTRPLESESEWMTATASESMQRTGRKTGRKAGTSRRHGRGAAPLVALPGNGPDAHLRHGLPHQEDSHQE
jgi:glycerol-3-phosphate dehydrogenase (NAD(P)+)